MSRRLALEVGDIVKVTSDGVEYSAPITSIVYDCDGGLKCSIESCGQSDTNNSINPTGPITSQMQRLTAELITANQVIATKYPQSRQTSSTLRLLILTHYRANLTR